MQVADLSAKIFLALRCFMWVYVIGRLSNNPKRRMKNVGVGNCETAF